MLTHRHVLPLLLCRCAAMCTCCCLVPQSHVIAHALDMWLASQPDTCALSKQPWTVSLLPHHGSQAGAGVAAAESGQSECKHKSKNGRGRGRK